MPNVECERRSAAHRLGHKSIEALQRHWKLVIFTQRGRGLKGSASSVFRTVERSQSVTVEAIVRAASIFPSGEKAKRCPPYQVMSWNSLWPVEESHTTTELFPTEAATLLPSGENATQGEQDPRSARVRISFPSIASHNRHGPIPHSPLAKVFPSREYASCAAVETLKRMRSFPVETSISRIHPLPFATANATPSGENAMDQISSSSVNFSRSSPVSGFHRRTVRSAPADARLSPLGE